MLGQVSSSSGVKQNLGFSKFRFFGLKNILKLLIWFFNNWDEYLEHLFIPEQSGSELQTSDTMTTRA